MRCFNSISPNQWKSSSEAVSGVSGQPDKREKTSFYIFPDNKKTEMNGTTITPTHISGNYMARPVMQSTPTGILWTRGTPTHATAHAVNRMNALMAAPQLVLPPRALGDLRVRRQATRAPEP